MARTRPTSAGGATSYRKPKITARCRRALCGPNQTNIGRRSGLLQKNTPAPVRACPAGDCPAREQPREHGLHPTEYRNALSASQPEDFHASTNQPSGSRSGALVVRYNRNMRITEHQHRTILAAARRAFGRDVTVRLFGSRTDNQRKGGDFDLYIECNSDDAERLTASKLKFLAELDASPALAGEKIDVVLSTPLHHGLRAIDRIARHQGVRL